MVIKILSQTSFNNLEEFEKNINFFLGKGYKLREFNTIGRDRHTMTSIAVLQKDEKVKI